MFCEKSLIMIVLFLLLPCVTLLRGDDQGVDLPLGDPALAYKIAAAEEGDFYDCKAGEKVAFDQLVERLEKVDIIILGEQHTNMDLHRFQAKIIDTLANRGHHLVLGMEFFRREDNPILEKWVGGSLDVDAFLNVSGWYDKGGFRFDYYLPIMQVVRDHKIPVRGLNVPRKIVSTVSRGGLTALSEEDKATIGRIDVGNSDEHRFLFFSYLGESIADMPPAWLDQMYQAQCVWDTVMARSILANLKAGEKMVVIVGEGHVAYGLGIPRRIGEEKTNYTVATFLPVLAPAPDPTVTMRGHPTGKKMHEKAKPRAIFVRSLADFVGVFKDWGSMEAYPLLGVSVREKENVFKVSWVTPDSLAFKAGLKMGDVILNVNGRTFTKRLDLKRYLATVNWGERVDIAVKRGDETLNVVMLLEPDVRYEKSYAVTGWSRAETQIPDPLSDEVVKASSTDEKAFLVCEGERLRWVEAHEGEAITALYILDENGHAVKVLYRDARPDGTVEIVVTRGPDGKVVRSEHFDRTGMVIRTAP